GARAGRGGATGYGGWCEGAGAPSPLVRLSLFVRELQPVGAHPEASEPIFHQPFLSIRRWPHELADPTIVTEAHLQPAAQIERWSQSHRVETIAVASSPSSRRRTYSPNIGSTKS